MFILKLLLYLHHHCCVLVRVGNSPEKFLKILEGKDWVSLNLLVSWFPAWITPFFLPILGMKASLAPVLSECCLLTKAGSQHLGWFEPGHLSLRLWQLFSSLWEKKDSDRIHKRDFYPQPLSVPHWPHTGAAKQETLGSISTSPASRSVQSPGSIREPKPPSVTPGSSPGLKYRWLWSQANRKFGKSQSQCSFYKHIFLSTSYEKFKIQLSLTWNRPHILSTLGLVDFTPHFFQVFAQVSKLRETFFFILSKRMHTILHSLSPHWNIFIILAFITRKYLFTLCLFSVTHFSV